MHQQSNSRSCTEEGIGGAHWGPVLAYMSKVEDAATADGSSEFFKVYENTWKKAEGSTQGDNDYWGTKDLNYNCGKLDFTIPEDIAPGDYLLRAEAIALHAASSSGGAQHYVTCYQLTVTGSGSATPSDTIKFPEGYSKTGPGLGFSIHAPLTEYPAPGPALYARGTKSDPQLLTFGKISGVPKATGGASAPASSKAAATSAAATSAAATSAATTTSAVATSAAEAEPTEAVTSAAATSAAATSAAASSVVASAPAASSTTAPETGDKKYDIDSFSTYLEAQPGSDAEFTIEEFISWLEKVESGSNTAEPTASASASAVASEVVAKPTTAVATQAPAQSSAAAPSSKKPSAPSTLATSIRPAPTSGSESGEVKEYGRCGGQDYTGSSTCASGLVCKVQNPYYSQCVKPEGGNAAQPSATKSAAQSGITKTAAQPSATKSASAPIITKEAVSSAAPSASAAPAADKLWTIEELIAFLEKAAE